MKKTTEASLPPGKLIEALEIDRESAVQTTSLHIKLQNEMSKPLNGSLRRDALDRLRLSKLKAAHAWAGGDLVSSWH